MVSDPDIESGIERYIGYIRRMSLLTDDQLRTILGQAFIQGHSAGTNTEEHILHIRKMSTYTDDQLREYLLQASNDPVMSEIFKDSAKRKALQDIKKMAKDMQGDARKFARKVDDF
jgi:hypothetical protein